MAVRIFHLSRPERALEPGETWVPATEEQVRWHSSSISMEKEPGWVVSHEGLVVGRREANWYDDSDFYARVWDPETESVKEVLYGSTRFWTYASGAEVDASEEILAKVAEAERKAREEYAAYLAREEAEREAQTVRKGKTVRVVKGRKVPVGTVAEVFWAGETAYGERVGLLVEGEKVFVSRANVEVVQEVLV